MTQKIFIELYEDENGRCPYLKWFDKLKNKKDAPRIENRVRRIETDGNFGTIESIGDGVFEFKFYFGPGYRIYFGKEDDAFIIILIGDDKGTQKRDIEKAKAYWKDYKERKDG
jgi:putative addiction module killer protein